MKIYVTRHGQVLPDECYGNAEFPKGDMPLSELGRKQAECLGSHLKSLGFSGKIYSSPYMRALETAEIIADYIGSEIIPWAPFREIYKNKIADFKGLSLDEIKEKYKYISSECELSDSWWSSDLEGQEDVDKRVKEEFEKLDIKEDVLFVGHGASVNSLAKLLGKKTTNRKFCNCSLSYYDSENKIKPFTFDDTGFLPYVMRGYNSVMMKNEDEKHVNELIDNLKIPDEFKNTKSKRLLHISDTPAYSYPYYKRLISELKPDIIIHTGDFSDELKVGRIPSVLGEYEENVKIIGDILTSSGAEKIYAVCGNNDKEEIIRKHLPTAEIIEAGNTLNICGITMGFAHGVSDVKDNAEWYFYGHGTTGETWKTEDNNIKSGLCRFNGVINISVIKLPERELLTIPYLFD